MIDKLEFLIALARAQHFGRAAEACGVTQPTLSAGIKSLEDLLGVPLVSRGSRYHGLTPEGLRTLEWARRIVGDSRALRADIRALRQGLTGHLRIAAVPTALPAVARLTKPYRARHPGVSFTVLSRTSLEILDLLENLEIDAGITYLDNEPLGRARAIALYREEYCLVVAPDHPLAARQSLTWAEAGRVSLCLLTPDMQNRRIVDRLLREAGAEPQPSLESNSMIVLLTHVRGGGWATIVPGVLAELFGTEALRAVPIGSARPMPTIGLVYGPRDPLAPMIATLVQEARASWSENVGGKLEDDATMAGGS